MPRQPEIAGTVPWRLRGDEVELGVLESPDAGTTLPVGPVGHLHPFGAALAAAARAGVAISPPGPRLELSTAPDDPAWLWPMEVTESDTAPGLTWLPLVRGAEQLEPGWQRQAVEALAVDGPHPWRSVVLVRHARAGKRGEYDGPDAQRPLDPRGRAQARALAGLLAAYRPTRIVSSDAQRSLETVAPLAAELDLVVEPEHLLSEDGSAAEPEQALVVLRSIVDKPEQIVVSIQRKTIERLLPDLLRGLGATGDPPQAPRKGGVIVLHMPLSDDRPVRVEELPPPEQRGTR